ncbi:hypothetical protein P7H06_22350 [Paenibacillus larvae]|nr:hypothetical protein [Paenibacillus larvae]MDT2261690.1 hypothetical protein [Paenibacillus larvae]
MTIQSLILSKLKELPVQVAFETPILRKRICMWSFYQRRTPAVCADDEEQLTKYFIQVDIWSKGDYTEIEKQVKQKMQELGAIRTSAFGLYAPDIRMYQKVFTFCDEHACLGVLFIAQLGEQLWEYRLG